MSESTASSPELARLKSGGQAALAEVFGEHRERLERMILFRMDPRIRRRIDAADVLQEAFLEISKRIPEYLAAPDVSCFVWMRQKALQTLIDLQRTHFRDKRTVDREVGWPLPNPNAATSMSIAYHLIDNQTTPSQRLVKAEEIERLRDALEQMQEIDREVLALRHFEQLTNLQVAEVLGLSPTAASNRYVRAAARLGEILQELRSAGE